MVEESANNELLLNGFRMQKLTWQSQGTFCLLYFIREMCEWLEMFLYSSQQFNMATQM